MMSDTLLVSTRKGLFTIGRKAGTWEIEKADFLGDNGDAFSGVSVAGSLEHGVNGQKMSVLGQFVDNFET